MSISQTRSATRARSELVSRRAELARSSQHNDREGQELRESNESRERSSSQDIAEVLVSLSENERLEVLAIDAAIGRIDLGTWGKCAGCGGRISLKRLSAMPEASSCLECQAAADTQKS
ncbi:MAG: C4-type zinc finger protein, DksA/TraR family [Myxococcaceae bacterium]|nr:C4-type zinc finger protein, DksA/TraR family [Myxococcaceae bacterium]